MITAVFSNPRRPEDGQCSVPLPIPDDQYDEIISMLESIGIGDYIARDCKLDEIRGDYPALGQLTGTAVNVDEMDYLAKRLDSFDEYEKTQFQGMAYRLDLHGADELINLTFCCNEATVVTDFCDLNTLGRRHFLTMAGGAVDMEEMQGKDFRAIALDVLEGEVGRVTPYGVVYDNDFEMEPIYNGGSFPEYRYKECVMEVEMSSRYAPTDSPAAHLYLPMTQEQLERAMLRAGIDSYEDMNLRFMESDLPDAVDVALDMECESIGDLNDMCGAIKQLSREDVAKLGVVVSFVKPESASQIKHLAEELDLFDFAPNVHTPEEYGRYIIRDSGRFEYDDNLDGYYDYERYGHTRVENEQGFFGDGGYVSYNGTLSLDELMWGSQTREPGGMEQRL